MTSIKVQSRNLIHLPTEVLHLIAGNLLHSSLTIPTYIDRHFGHAGTFHKLGDKCTEYYGERTDDQNQCARGLLNWSITSKQFHAFLTPYINKTVILRDLPSSINSIKHLSNSASWNDVQNLIFTTASNQARLQQNKVHWTFGSSDLTKETEHKQAIENLSAIVSRLPPNLQSLTIDIPSECRRQWHKALMWGLPPDTSSDRSPYRLMVREVLNAISLNDISRKSSFELKLHNLAPFHSLVYDSERWKVFLGSVTSFTLGLCHYDNGGGWKLNTFIFAKVLASSIGQYFWDNLLRVRSFNLHCDESWPLGAPSVMLFPLDLPLPSTQIWNDLKHVSFKKTFLCNQMLAFLKAHLVTIETVDLVDCFGPFADGDISGHVTWSVLFERLAETEPSSLQGLSIEYVSKSEDDMLEIDEGSEEDRQLVKHILREGEIESQSAHGHEKNSHMTLHKKKLLAYCGIDEKYGYLVDMAEFNILRFLDGEDHDAWLKLLQVMDENQVRSKASSMSFRSEGAHNS